MEPVRRCECDVQSDVPTLLAWMYSEEEKSSWGHAPNKCPCTAGLAQYKRHGKTVWLCSACCLSSDVPVKQTHQMAYHEILGN